MKKIISIISLLFVATITMAQDGNAGINEATNQVKSYFSTGTNLMYAIGAIVGLVGAIKVYKKWKGEAQQLEHYKKPEFKNEQKKAETHTQETSKKKSKGTKMSV